MRHKTRGLWLIGSIVALSACGSSSTTAGSSTAASPAASASPSSGAAALAKAAEYEGTYNGTWKNTTFNTTGSIKLTIRVDKNDSKVEMTLTLGGSVFGGTAPGPLLMDADPEDDGGLSIDDKLDAFGETQIDIDPQGNITWTSSDVPSPRVKSFTAKGIITGSAVKMTSDITFRDGSPVAHDTVELTK
ncbi:MAG: hypothetical protein QOE92_767 [Chloroflexota bacterium]|nr:hypothetical protein [Chloroflexota bacterium]